MLDLLRPLHGSSAEISGMKTPLVLLGTLIGRELRNEKSEKPFLKYGQAALAKKGEDCFLIKPDCQDSWENIFFCVCGETSGTTVTFVVTDGWTVTIASVGDSRCILDTQGVVISLLTVDHRLEENAEERERVTASGGEVGRLNIFGGKEVGPLRCWPGGLCLSRSIGDTYVGDFIAPIPHVKQVKTMLQSLVGVCLQSLLPRWWLRRL